MSDQYYYLLDGKEHGPFSRAAIESLLAKGKLHRAVLRTDKTQAWQTAEEVGLVAKTESATQPEKGSRPDTDYVFQKQDAPKNKPGTIRLIIGVIAIAVGIFFLLQKFNVIQPGSIIGSLGSAKTTQLLPEAVKPRGTTADNEAQIGTHVTDAASEVAQSSQQLQFHGRYVYGTNPDEGPFFVIYPSADELSTTPARGYDKLILDGFEARSIKSGLPDLSTIDTDCEIEGTTTLSISNIRLAQQQAYGEGHATDTVAKATISHINSISRPTNLPEECRTASHDQSTSDSSNSKPLLTSGYLRFSSAAEVLELARRKQTDDWNADAMRECECTINGNVIELSADSNLVLYNDASGPSVIAYYWEDNHGNPNTHFYRYDGSWVDAGHDVMPGYTGKYNDYFKATANGITKSQGEGKPPSEYVYRSGAFEVVM